MCCGRRADRRLTGMVEDYSDLRLDTEATVLDAAPMTATGELAEATDLQPGAPLYRISRRRHTSILHELQVTLEPWFDTGA